MKQRRQEELEWDAAHPQVHVDEAVYARDILPRLQDLPLSQISAGIGLSQQYCSLIRRGLKVPHPRHLHKFEALIESLQLDRISLKADTYIRRDSD